MKRLQAAVAVIAGVFCQPALAFAGMPMLTLNEVARMRLQTISFFLLGFLLSAWFIQLLWNRLRTDFTRLPRLSYGKALGIVVLWGFLFVLVLTMISGARELLTPGAWEKQGATYRLASQASNAGDAALEEKRQRQLEQLRTALWSYAQAHAGRFPPHRADPWVPPALWEVPDPSGLYYLYVPDPTASQARSILAFEPEIFGPKRLVLFTNGEIRPMRSDEISQAQAVEHGRR